MQARDDIVTVPREWLDELLVEVAALKASLSRLEPKLVAELDDARALRTYERLRSRTPWETTRTG